VTSATTTSPAAVAQSRAVARRACWRRRLVNLVFGILPIAALVALWWLAVELKGGDSLFLVSPQTAAERLVDLLRDGSLLRDTWASLQRVIFGVAIATAVGIPLGIGIGWIPFVQRTFKPIVELVRPVPIPSWIPLFILLFGIGQKPAVLLIALASFIPIVVNTWDGVRYTNAIHVRAVQMLGASPLQVLRYVVFPSALPGIFTGLRLGVGIAVMAVVLAELMAVRSGLGYMIQLAQVQFEMPTVIVGIISTAVLGFCLGALVNLAARRLMPWRER
jgi:ABC-type nitrate/sulfonate/bicarbonate transport system permease component